MLQKKRWGTKHELGYLERGLPAVCALRKLDIRETYEGYLVGLLRREVVSEHEDVNAIDIKVCAKMAKKYIERPPKVTVTVNEDYKTIYEIKHYGKKVITVHCLKV